MSLVKCISIRPRHEDTLYKTGTWLPDEVKKVPDEIAKRMLRHADVYETATEEEAPDAQEVVLETPVKDDEKDRVQETYDAIAKMNKESIRAFVKTNFNRPVDLRQPEAKLRAYATQLVDQYGIL